MKDHDPERDALVDQLTEVLDWQERLYLQRGEVMRGYDQDGANAIALNRGWRGK